MKCIKFFCIMLLLFSVFIEPIKVFAEAVHGMEENVVEESLSSDEEMRETDRNGGDTTFSSAESDQTGVEENAKDVFEKYVEDESGSIASLAKNDDFQSEWGNIDYTFGLTVSDGDIRTWTNQHYLTKENTYFLIKSKEGKYSYGKTVYLPNSGSYISDAKFATKGGEVDTDSKKFGASASTTYYFNFKPEFHTFYEGNTKGQDPCKGKDLNYFLNWINFWSYEDVSIIEMEEMSLDHYVRYLNKGVEYQQQDIDFTQSLTVSDGADADIRTWTNQHYLKKEDTYFLIKSKEGKYSYGKTVYLPNSGSYISDAKFAINGGEVDTEARKFGASTSTTYYFNFKPEFHIFYEGVPRAYDPCKGKDLNYFLNWINFWSYEEVSIIKMEYMALDHYVRKLNKNIEYQLENTDYTKGLTVSENSDADIRTWANQHYLTKENTYFLIKSKEGKYSYGKTVYLPNSGSYISDAKFVISGGEVDNETKKYGVSSSSIYYFNFKPEFHTFYEDVPRSYDPCKGKELNYFLNWINFWSHEEVSIINTQDIELHVAKKNGLVRDWKFFEMGRSSKNDQFYSLKLSDITRLNFEIIGTTSKVIKIYNKSEQKICETKYAKGNTSFSLDLPSGEYYVVLTGLTAETKLQITRSHFNDLQLSVDTTLNRTTIYVNGQVNQELTDIYAYYNKSSDTQDVVQITNSLLSIWKKPDVSCESLDMLFGKNLRLSMPSLQHYSLISMGNKPLGSTLYTAPIQYLGQGRYFSEKNIFTMTIGPQPKFLVIDDLFYLALLGTIMVSYSAYVVNTNNLTLTMPSFSGFDVGNWDELDQYEEEMNKVMANPNYKEYKIDCSEIAEDLFAVNPKGTVYNIVAEDGKEFYVSEYGGIKEYYYHVVFSYNGLIYDPRYSPTPVQKDIYFRELQALNTKKLHVYEIQL